MCFIYLHTYNNVTTHSHISQSISQNRHIAKAGSKPSRLSAFDPHLWNNSCETQTRWRSMLTKVMRSSSLLGMISAAEMGRSQIETCHYVIWKCLLFGFAMPHARSYWTVSCFWFWTAHQRHQQSTIPFHDTIVARLGFPINRIPWKLRCVRGKHAVNECLIIIIMVCSLSISNEWQRTIWKMYWKRLTQTQSCQNCFSPVARHGSLDV